MDFNQNEKLGPFELFVDDIGIGLLIMKLHITYSKC